MDAAPIAELERIRRPLLFPEPPMPTFSASTSTYRGGVVPTAPPDVFDSTSRMLGELRDTFSAREAELERRASELAKAQESFAERLRVVKARYAHEREEIEKDREATEDMREEAIAEILRSEKRIRRAEAREGKVAEWEACVAARATDVERLGEQVAFREMAADTREEEVSWREEAVARCEEAAEKRALERLATERRSLELRAADLISRAREESDRRIRELEDEVRRFGDRAEGAERQARRALRERDEHLDLLRETFRRVRRVADCAGLGRVGGGMLISVGHVALALGDLEDRLEELGARLQGVLVQEGRQLAAAVAEHVLACYRSRDPHFSLVPAQLWIAESREVTARAAVREVAAEIAQGFSREDAAIESPRGAGGA